jgi:lysophospholipase L1-like esterase
MQVRLPVRLSWIFSLILASACSSAPSGPPPTLSCPAPIQVVSPDNNPVPVTYQTPVAGGSQPVTATCSPPSGSLFAVGTTAVGCSAAASDGTVSCNFNVSVAPPPHLEKTRTLAFGDSITFGSDGICPFGSSGMQWTPADLLRSHFAELAAVASPYPAVLQGMLQARYTAQSPTVFNGGLPGEYANDSETRRRFTRTLNERNPEIVLLQEGINDLHVFALYGIPPSQGIRGVVEALRGMSLEARGRGMQVFLGTLLPERPNGCRAFAIPPKNEADLITPTNDQIRAMAAAEHLDLIDLNALFSGQLDTLLGQDGLHPSEAGYSAIANAFYNAIKEKYEKPQSSALRRGR